MDEPRDDAKYLEFRDDGDDLAVVGVHPPFSPHRTSLLTWISHGEETRPKSLLQRFVAPDSDGAAPQLSLRGPFTGGSQPHPRVSLYREGKAAVVEVHSFGELAEENVFVDLSVTRWPEAAQRLVVESTVELAENGVTGPTHVLEGHVEFTIARGDERSSSTPEPS